MTSEQSTRTHRLAMDSFSMIVCGVKMTKIPLQSGAIEMSFRKEITLNI